MLALLLVVGAEVLASARPSSYLQTDPAPAAGADAATKPAGDGAAGDGAAAPAGGAAEGDAPAPAAEEPFEDKVEMRNLATDLKTVLEQRVHQVTKELEGQFENGNTDMADKASEMHRSIDAVAEGSRKSIGAIFDQLKAVDQGLQARMDAAERASEMQGEAQASKQQEVLSLAQRTTDSFKAEQRHLETSLNTVEGMATSLGPDIQGAKDTAEKDTADVASGVAEQAKKATDQAKADMEQRVAALKQDVDDASKDARTQLASVVQDVTAQREQSEKQMGARLDKLAADQQEAQTSLAGVGQKLENEVQKMATLGQEQDSALASAMGSLESKFGDVTATVGLAKETATKKLENSVKDATASLAKLDSSKYEEAKADMQKRIAEVKLDTERYQKQVTTATDNVKAEHKRLEEQIKGVSLKADESKALIDTTEEKISQAISSMDAKAKEQRTANEAKLEKLDGEVKQQLADQATAIKTNIAHEGVVAKQNLDLAAGAISTKIKELEEQLTAATTSSFAQRKASQKTAQSLLQGIQHVASDIRAEKEEVTAHVPKATEALRRAYAGVGQKVATVQQQLKDQKDEVLQVLSQSTNQLDAAAQASLAESEARVQQQLQHQSGIVEHAMGSLVEQVAALQEHSARDYDAASRKQQDVVDQLNAQRARADQIRQRTEDQAGQLRGKIAAAVDLLKRGDASQTSEAEALEQSLQQLVHEQTAAATKKAGQAIKSRMDRQNAELTDFERRAAMKLKADSSLLQTYAKSTDLKLSKVQEHVSQLGLKVQKTELAATNKHRDLIQQASSLADQQRMLAEKQQQSVHQARAMIDQRSSELEKVVEEKLNAVKAADHEQISLLEKQASSALLAEKARQETERNKVDETLKSWQEELGGEIHQVGSHVEQSKANLQQFADEQQRKHRQFAQDVAAMDAAIAQGEDRVDQQLQREDQQVQRVLQGQLGQVHGLVEQLHGVQGDAQKKAAELHDAYAEQLRFVKAQADEKSAALGQKLQRVEAANEDLKQRFSHDQAATEQQLAQTKARLAKVAGRTHAELHQYSEQLAQAQRQRQEHAKKVDARIDATASSLAETFETSSAKIDALKKEASHAYAEVSQQQRDLVAGLQKQAQEKEQQDAVELQAVEDKMAEVADSQSRMGQWQEAFTRRAQQWREEVSHRLASLLPSREPSTLAQDTDLTGDLAGLRTALAGNGSATSLLEEDADARAARLERENSQLRLTNAALLSENKHLYEVDSKLDARIAALAEQVEKA